MTKRNSLLSLVLALCLCFMMAVPALAAEDNTVNNDGEASVMIEENGESGIEPYSTSIPDKFWDLSEEGSYSGTFYDLRTSRMYTNYYFSSIFTAAVKCQAAAPRRSFSVGIYCIDCKDVVALLNNLSTPTTPWEWSSTAYIDNSTHYHSTGAGHRMCPFVRNTSNDDGGSLIAMNGEVYVSWGLGR